MSGIGTVQYVDNLKSDRLVIDLNKGVPSLTEKAIRGTLESIQLIFARGVGMIADKPKSENYQQSILSENLGNLIYNFIVNKISGPKADFEHEDYVSDRI